MIVILKDLVTGHIVDSVHDLNVWSWTQGNCNVGFSREELIF